MDEGIAAILVAFITGVCSVLGIVFTQVLAKKNFKKIDPSPPAIAQAAATAVPPPSMDYLAAVKYEVKDNGMVMKEGLSEVKEDLSELKMILREHAQEDRINLEMIHRCVKGLKDD